MNLAQAMKRVLEGAANSGEQFTVLLSCSFTPQHLGTFLAAHLFERLPGRKVAIRPGAYGDLLSGLRQIEASDFNSAVVVIEWADLDSRLGLRSSQRVSASQAKDLVENASARLEALTGMLGSMADHFGVSVALPSLPAPPLFATPLARADPTVLLLEESLSKFKVQLAGFPNVRVLNRDQLDRLSAPSLRHDLKSELRWDFPYQIGHCEVLARLLSNLAVPGNPKKGIITDLDGTLWCGILGDDGVDKVSWDLDHGSHDHGIYQRMLTLLADAGVLIAVASKNDRDVVEMALARKDLIVERRQFFPVEANWEPKSRSVQKILKIWNIGPESVVFIDDSAMELAEVQAAFPEILGIRYPEDSADLLRFLAQIRDLFGKASITEEDRLRSTSLRQSHERPGAGGTDSGDEFLAEAGASIGFRFNQPDQRMFDLVNKTNQFNLNGRRVDESSWRRLRSDPDAFVLGVSYQDKFGPLGTIAVVTGKKENNRGRIRCWVMSCRAFSRRIEFQVLRVLFEKLDVETLELELVATERNGPLREFIRSAGGDDASTPVAITRTGFLSRCPPLFAVTHFE